MDARSLEAKEMVPASRKLGEAEAKDLVRQASSVVVAKGKNVTKFDGGRASAETVAALLGPTGNLRAPTIRSGKKLLVGFNEEEYEAVFG